MAESSPSSSAASFTSGGGAGAGAGEWVTPEQALEEIMRRYDIGE